MGVKAGFQNGTESNCKSLEILYKSSNLISCRYVLDWLYPAMIFSFHLYVMINELIY